MSSSEPSGEDWDQAFADDLVGSSLLVGVTYLDYDSALLRRKQVFGVVESVDSREGIVLSLGDGDDLFTIAPILEAIKVSELGLYQLADSDRTVENPDFTALFTVTETPRN